MHMNLCMNEFMCQLEGGLCWTLSGGGGQHVFMNLAPQLAKPPHPIINDKSLIGDSGVFI